MSLANEPRDRAGLLLTIMLLLACSRGSPVPGGGEDLAGGALDLAGGDAAPGGLCGGRRCRAEQTCVAQACTFPCAGARVPGDYATVRAALEAVGRVGGTICLGAQTFAETFVASPARDVTLIGVSPDRSIVDHLQIARGAGQVTVRGVGFADGVSVLNSTVSLSACTVRVAAQRPAVSIQIDRAMPFSVTIDGCDVQGKGSYSAVNVHDPGYGGWTLKVTNSYLHEGNAGVAVYQSLTTMNGSVELVNNTIVGANRGIESARVSGGSAAITLTYINNLITGNQIGASIFAGTATLVHRNNVFAGNTTNYSGIATAGPGYVTADPLLDTGVVPPGLRPGSPCRGAGDSQAAPAADFWGQARRPRADIGAVQASQN